MAYVNTYTKAEQRALATEKVARVKQQIRRDATEIFSHPETFANYLDFMARFHYYDAHNTVLIYGQKPEAEYLASFKVWQQLNAEYWNDPNRPVFTTSQKDKGLALLSPYILKKTIQAAAPADRKSVSYYDFHVVFAFDKEQTNNIPMPFLPWQLSKSADDCRALFHALKESKYFDVLFEDGGRKGNYAYTPPANPDSKGLLVLNPADSENYYKLCSYVLNIYIAEFLRSRLKSNSEDEFNKTHECVKYVLASYFDLPRDKDGFFFIRLWGNNNPDRILGILNRIQRLSHTLIEALEEELVFQKSITATNDVYDDDDIFDVDDIYGFNQL